MVPYNKDLNLKFYAHINIEICLQSMKHMVTFLLVSVQVTPSIILNYTHIIVEIVASLTIMKYIKRFNL